MAESFSLIYLGFYYLFPKHFGTRFKEGCVRLLHSWRFILLEAMIKHFIKNMSKEEKQKMMQEFMNGMSEEEKTEMIQLMMPIMMKDMEPSTMMTGMMKNLSENDCRKMMMEMPSEMRQKCKRMMKTCLQACEEIERTSQQ
jgi:hypothetical protein